MKKELQKETWVWVIIQNPGGKEEIIGQLDEKANVSFIPTFYSKEDAFQNINLLARDKGIKFEPQAIILEDLCAYAVEQGFILTIINNEGQPVDHLNPRIISDPTVHE